MTVPCAGADAKVSELDPVPETLYDRVFCESDGYCITPSNATKILSLLTTALDKVNVVVLPSAVNVSTLLSEMSNVGKLFATRFPKITSEEEGAAENTITDPFESIPYPFAGDVESCGLCITPLCDKNN